MTLCDWIVLLELAVLAVAGVRIWQLGSDRDRVSAELDAAHLAGAAVRLERDRLAMSSADLRDDRCALALQIRVMRRAVTRHHVDRDAHADRAQQLAKRVTELEKDLEDAAALQVATDTELVACRERMREAGARIDELIADNAAALGIQSGGEP